MLNLLLRLRVGSSVTFELPSTHNILDNLIIQEGKIFGKKKKKKEMMSKAVVVVLLCLLMSSCHSYETTMCEDPETCDVSIGGDYVDQTGVQSMIENEFDPTSEEGILFQISSMESLDILARRDFTPTQEGDTTDVETAFTECYNLWKSTADNYSGMRDFKGAIIGAGDLKGIPINLFKDYEEVALADVSLESTRDAIVNLPDPTAARAMSFFQEDVTGMIGGFRWKTEYLFGIVETQDKAYEAISDYIESPYFYPKHQQYDTPFNSSLRYASTSDVIVINLMLHQLGPVYISHLGSELRRLKSERWNNVVGLLNQGLGMSTVTLHNKLRRRFVSELTRKMSYNPNRKLLIIITLDKQIEYMVDDSNTVLRQSVIRNGNVDTDIIDLFKSNGTLLSETTSTMTTRRWESNGQRFKLDETVRITGITFNDEMTFQEYLESIRNGRNSEMYTN